MDDFHTNQRQYGFSAFALIGCLLVIVGVIGLGIGLIEPGSSRFGVATASQRIVQQGRETAAEVREAIGGKTIKKIGLTMARSVFALECSRVKPRAKLVNVAFK